MEEMEQRYPIPALKAQQEQRQAASTTSNRKRGRPRKNRAIQDEQDLTEEEDKSPVKKNSAHLQALTTKGSSSGSSSNSSEGASKQKSSRISKIQQNNPPKREENKELTDQFVELGDHELKHGEKQKGISRMKVAKELRNTEQVIESGEQARHLERVGPSASKKVDEIRNKGTIKALKRYHEEEEEEAEDVPQKS
jgi:ribosome-binding protein aMBF1 (putative translation factor)